MVCISCIVIPLLLYIWHRFLQPLALKIWNPWQSQVEDKTGEAKDENKTSTCPFTKSDGGGEKAKKID